MAELFDKLIQDGRVSFVPRNQKTRQFWTRYNAKVAGSQNAAKETVTWMPASEEEVAEWRKDSEPTGKVSAIVAPPVMNTDLDDLKKQMQLQQEQIKQQQEMITQLLQAQVNVTETPAEKERAKPGPKPKNSINGEGQ
jgi:hypothetical protein